MNDYKGQSAPEAVERHERPLWVDLRRLAVITRRAGVGATLSFPRVLGKVPSPFDLLTFVALQTRGLLSLDLCAGTPDGELMEARHWPE